MGVLYPALGESATPLSGTHSPIIAPNCPEKKKGLREKITQALDFWRRVRDSNPGYGCPYNGFRIRFQARNNGLRIRQDTDFTDHPK
tara:strand:+ start:73 stop:333 length:261 start_codon:yes stop_codon:yes gene_type:complete